MIEKVAAPDPFEDDPPERLSDEAFVLRLDAYEGPIDVLLDQARDQKVDLTQISILALAEQYLSFVERARSLRIELAADYLVMAAWLAYLKSRLLLPMEEDREEPTAAELAAALAFQLRRLEAIRDAGERLMSRRLLGRDHFARGEVETTAPQGPVRWLGSIGDLLSAYGALAGRRAVEDGALHIEASRLYSMEDALQRLQTMLGSVPTWTALWSFLPPGIRDPLVMRSAIAAHLVATLELARAGRIEIRQDGDFGPIFLKGKRTDP